MQTLPLDRKSPRPSTPHASTPKAPARAPAEPRAGSEKRGNLAALLAELWAPPGARLSALARRFETLGRGLFRVGVEPLAYTAGLWSRLARLLRASRELMEMGHRASRNDAGSQAPPPAGPRKTHRLASLRTLCRRRERGRVAHTRRSGAAARGARRVTARVARSTGVSIPR